MKVPISRVAAMENAHYGHMKVGDTELTGQLTQVARDVDGAAGGPKDGYVSREELVAYQKQIDGSRTWNASTKTLLSRSVQDLMGYEASPAKLDADLAKEEAGSVNMVSLAVVMGGGLSQVPEEDRAKVLAAAIAGAQSGTPSREAPNFTRKLDGVIRPGFYTSTTPQPAYGPTKK
ncbi:MAG: hypothetical protein K1X89_15460 [Myxococcaceae bacterium]|nr:hypothetical protein [Myxococcaceae bacterium]